MSHDPLPPPVTKFPHTSSSPLIIFGIIGALLLFAACVVTVHFAAPTTGVIAPGWAYLAKALEILSSALITAVALGGFWRLVGGDPVETGLAAIRDSVEIGLTAIRDSVTLLGDSHATGLKRVVPCSGNFGSHGIWMSRLKSARSRVDLMGYTLHVWTKSDNFKDEMVGLVNKGVKVRVLLMHEDNPSLAGFINTTQIHEVSVAAVKEEIRNVQRVFEAIKDEAAQTMAGENKKGEIEIRHLMNGVIVCQLCITDNQLTAVQYLFSAVASRTPLLEVEGAQTDLFAVYTREFEQVWGLARAAAPKEAPQN